MDALGGASSALRVSDDPAHGVAGRDGPRARELFAGFQGDVGDLARSGVDLIERAVRVRIDLDRIDIARPGRLDARRAIGLVDAGVWVGRLGVRSPCTGERLELARQGEQLRQFDDLHRLGRVRLQDGLLRRVVVGISGGFQAVAQAASETEASNRVPSVAMRISRAPLTS